MSLLRRGPMGTELLPEASGLKELALSSVKASSTLRFLVGPLPAPNPVRPSVAYKARSGSMLVSGSVGMIAIALARWSGEARSFFFFPGGISAQLGRLAGRMFCSGGWSGTIAGAMAGAGRCCCFVWSGLGVVLHLAAAAAAAANRAKHQGKSPSSRVSWRSMMIPTACQRAWHHARAVPQFRLLLPPQTCELCNTTPAVEACSLRSDHERRLAVPDAVAVAVAAAVVRLRSPLPAPQG